MKGALEGEKLRHTGPIRKERKDQPTELWARARAVAGDTFRRAFVEKSGKEREPDEDYSHSLRAVG